MIMYTDAGCQLARAVDMSAGESQCCSEGVGDGPSSGLSHAAACAYVDVGRPPSFCSCPSGTAGSAPWLQTPQSPCSQTSWLRPLHARAEFLFCWHRLLQAGCWWYSRRSPVQLAYGEPRHTLPTYVCKGLLARPTAALPILSR